MNADFVAAMRRATMLTRARDIAGATRLIQATLAGRTEADPHFVPSNDIIIPQSPQGSARRLIDREAEIVDDLSGATEPSSSEPGPADPSVRSRSAERIRLPRRLGEVLEALRDARAKLGALDQNSILKARRRPPIPEGAQFLTRCFACTAGERSYKLYVPASAPDRPRGLVVMLHGCKQDPDDFATGTNMNAVAERHGMLVAYPCQPGTANAMSCWNWFRPTDQVREAGEPAIIAGLTREVMREFGLERHSVFVAGLSAGGAMAAVMGETYPDLYAAVGVHSGLAYGSATDVMSAFATMRGEVVGRQPDEHRVQMGSAPSVRTIVFHGSEDPIVHPSNAERIIVTVLPNAAADRTLQQRSSQDGGRNYTRTVVTDAGGDPVMEYWLVEGGEHAWSGGDPCGSYTDPTGPDASSEMMRFFLALQATERA